MRWVKGFRLTACGIQSHLSDRSRRTLFGLRWLISEPLLLYTKPLRNRIVHYSTWPSSQLETLHTHSRQTHSGCRTWPGLCQSLDIPKPCPYPTRSHLSHLVSTHHTKLSHLHRWKLLPLPPQSIHLFSKNPSDRSSGLFPCTTDVHQLEIFLQFILWM